MTDELELPPEVFAIFREEARDHLATVARLLATLEGGAPAAGVPSLLQDLARRLHSLKGSAAGLGLDAVSKVAHAAESLLKKDATVAPPAHALQGLLKATAWLQEAIVQERPVAATILSELQAAAQAPTVEEATPTPGPAAPPAAHPDRPTVADRPAASPRAPEARPAALGAGDDFVRVRTQALDRLLRPLSMLANERAESRRRAERLHELREVATRLARKAEGEPLAPTDADELRVLAERLDDESAAQKRASHHVARAVGSLEQELQLLRLVSLGSLADTLRLAARDAALRTGKIAEFSVEGEQVRLDRRTLEELRAPLIHLVRNAIDHGIEAPAGRRAAGKPRAGRVTLRCSSDGTMVSLAVEDDGAGIDLDALRATANARGLWTDQDREPSPDDVWRIISSPGFSTRAKVSEVSGRGVGMDVVDAAVRKLGGLVGVWSERGRGARFTLRLPASVLTTRVMLARVSGQTFALPLSGVEHTRAVAATARYETGGRTLVDVGGRTARLHHLGGASAAQSAEQLRLVLVQTPSSLAALAVDEILGEEEVAVRPLGPPVRRLRGVVGSTVVESGKVVVVLDPRELLELEDVGRATAPAAVEAPRVTGRVLVVDDSITTRTLERHILERNGFTVRLANDGVEALAALRAAPVDLVVSDVEMPNLDGLGLARAMRADPALERIPLILVTSLATEDDRRRGLAAGAQVYLVKSRFDQERLLSAIREQLGARRGNGG